MADPSVRERFRSACRERRAFIGRGGCGAQVVDATSPIWSPFLERYNSSFTIPSEEWIARFGERTWLVMHEGAKESSGE